MSLVEKLVAVSKEIGFLEFDKSNTGQGYKYVSAASVIRKLNLELAKHGILAYVREERVSHFQEFVNTKGNKSMVACVECTLSFTDGVDSIHASGVGSGSDSGDKAVMKASTAAYKYAIAHALTLGWDAADPEEDSDTPRSQASTGTGRPASTGKGKGTPKATKGQQKPAQAPENKQVDLDDAILDKEIGEATTEAQLDALRTRVLKVKDRDLDAFNRLKQAVVDRRAAISKEKAA